MSADAARTRAPGKDAVGNALKLSERGEVTVQVRVVARTAATAGDYPNTAHSLVAGPAPREMLSCGVLTKLPFESGVSRPFRV